MYILCAMVIQQRCVVLKLECWMVEYPENDMFQSYQYRLSHKKVEVNHSNEPYQNQ